MTAATDQDPGTRERRSRRGGPPLPLPAAAYAGLTIAGTVTWAGPLPTADAPAALATLQAHPVAATLSATLVLAASVPLAVWTASVSARLQQLGVRVAGPVIGLVGGVLAAGALALSGLVGVTAASAGALGDPALVRALATLSFVLGGVGFALGFALLVVGVAVPTLILRLVPRWLAVAGLVVAGVAVLTLLALPVPALAPLLPVARFGGLLWLLAVSVALPVTRPRRTA